MSQVFSAPIFININVVNKTNEDKKAKSLSFFILNTVLYKNNIVKTETNILGILKINSNLLLVIIIVNAVSQVGKGGFSKRN